MNRCTVATATVLAALSAACGSARLAPEQIGARDSLPPWDYGHAARSVTRPKPHACSEPALRGHPVSLRLLAWRTFERGASRQDEAFWWASYLTPEGPRWVLAMTLRPDGRAWRLAVPRRAEPCHGRSAAYRRFDDPPTSADAIALLQAAGPTLTTMAPGAGGGDWFHPWILAGSGWRLRDAVLRPTAWRATFGEAPPDEFQP